MKKIVSLAFIFCLSAIPNFLFAGLSAPVDSTITLLLKKVPLWMTEHHVPVTGVGLIENGKIKWVHVFGQLRPGKSAPENTLFNIASQTKPVTAMLVMKLVQSGSWNLDEPLADFWTDPDLKGDSNLSKLTTRYVLSHQTGFPNWRTDNGGTKLKFMFTPGTRFGYSGEGFEYLRRALEIKFRLPLDKLMDSLLFKPAGMQDTRYWGQTLDTSRFARWFDGQGNLYPVSIQTPVSAADDLITTIGDYCRFGLYVMQGLGLPDSLFNDVIRPQVKTKEDYYRGLGWGLIKGLPGDGYALEHGGSDIGVRTMAIFLPGSQSGIVVMTNADNGLFVYDEIIRLALPGSDEILAKMNQVAQSHIKTELPFSVIDRYTGTYQQSNGKQMFVARQGNALSISGDGIPGSLVYPESNTKFFLQGYDVQIEFFPPGAGDGMSLAAFESGKQVLKADRVSRSTTR